VAETKGFVKGVKGKPIMVPDEAENRQVENLKDCLEGNFSTLSPCASPEKTYTCKGRSPLKGKFFQLQSFCLDGVEWKGTPSTEPLF